MNSKPVWLRKRVCLDTQNIEEIKNLLEKSHLHTVCQSAKCPNIFECFGKKTATFMIMGNICTRSCGFCGVEKGKPADLDPDEPGNIAEASKKMGLKYIVITSVTRDDLEDGGAKHFAKTVEEIKKLLPGSRVECLIPDFNGNLDSLNTVLEKDLTVLNHNLETIKRNYPTVRKKASYERSLSILKSAKKLKPSIYTKSGFMLGFGEEIDEVKELLSDLEKTGCDIVTIGQYLRPSDVNLPVEKYYSLEEFDKIKRIAESFGFKSVACGPFVRSSYFAETVLDKLEEG